MLVKATLLAGLWQGLLAGLSASVLALFPYVLNAAVRVDILKHF